jgi:orotate phosphoribosyltransferase-like protein
MSELQELKRVLFTPERNQKAVALRNEGLSFQQIADQLGYPSQWAAKWAVASFVPKPPTIKSLRPLDFTDAQDMKNRGSYLYPFTMEDVSDDS